MNISIAGRVIGDGAPCFVIAEAGVNHNGSIETACRLVDVAAASGADCVKFQLYRAEEQVSRAAMTADYQKERTGSTTMLEMARSYDLPWEAHRDIAAYCRQKNIMYLASCFEPAAVDFLLGLGADAVKVGSGEITNYPLLAHIGRTGRAVLLSTGMSTIAEVAVAVDTIRMAGDSPILLFQCVSSYPAPAGAINLRAMGSLHAAFGVPVGYSDHTIGNTVAVAAVALGASIIEKHFTIDKNLPGPDHAMSLAPDELANFVTAIRIAEASLGTGLKEPHASEMASRTVARRSVVSTCLIRAGQVIGRSDLTLKRPATGIEPRDLAAVVGRVAAVDIPDDIPVAWEMLR